MMEKAPRTAGKARWRGGRIAARIVLPLMLAPLLFACAYACVGHGALAREIRDTPRDPATGIVTGTEALTLDPPASADTPTSAVLLVHGFVGSRTDFADLGARLAAAGFHVDLMRLPGHGTTPADFRRQTPESLLRAVQDEYRMLRRRYRTVDVVGFSMGGSLATLLAAQSGPAPDRLVLAAPYYGVTYAWWYVLPPAQWNTLFSPVIPYVIKSDRFIKLNRREARANLFSYRCIPTRGVKTLLELGRRASRPETLRAVRCPTLMTIADGDEAACPHCAHAAFAGLGSTRKQALWLGTRSNHHLFWDYDREEVMTAIVNFLSREP